jgi:hypothetical protein
MVGESKTCGQVDVLDERTPVGPEQWWYCVQGEVKNLDEMLVADTICLTRHAMFTNPLPLYIFVDTSCGEIQPCGVFV